MLIEVRSVKLLSIHPLQLPCQLVLLIQPVNKQLFRLIYIVGTVECGGMFIKNFISKVQLDVPSL